MERYLCLSAQDTGIDWGDSEAPPVEIEIVNAGTDCKCVFVYIFCFIGSQGLIYR